ncbi:E3 ubiquitin-protein ligase rnf4 [Dispira parvispora]|uniref:E3 ubiquitin-protein ligase rnf4 n=1 Tax=Dispira parvispora TaxID=1520584 RepID=A0A9W8AS72_9FUNG|nr:E3 ubiquitin-protein ligase rnf4 [Dispira parvispora]
MPKTRATHADQTPSTSKASGKRNRPSGTNLRSPRRKATDRPAIPNEIHIDHVALQGIPAIQCAICLEPPDPAASATCGHVFCEMCVLEAVRTLHTCPVCRTHITRKSIHVLQFPVTLVRATNTSTTDANPVSESGVDETGTTLAGQSTSSLTTNGSEKPETKSSQQKQMDLQDFFKRPTVEDTRHSTHTAVAVDITPTTISSQGDTTRPAATLTPSNSQQSPLIPNTTSTAPDAPLTANQDSRTGKLPLVNQRSRSGSPAVLPDRPHISILTNTDSSSSLSTLSSWHSQMSPSQVPSVLSITSNSAANSISPSLDSSKSDASADEGLSLIDSSEYDDDASQANIEEGSDFSDDGDFIPPIDKRMRRR